MRTTTLLGLAAVLASIGAVIACVGDSPTPASQLSCTNYCNQIMQGCVQMDTDSTGATGDNLVYKTLPTCLDMCNFFKPGTIGDGDDTLGCRIGQLSNLQDPHTVAERHGICLNAAAFSTACGSGDLCTHFCELDPLVCGSLNHYPDNATCLKTCGGFAESNGFLPGPFVNSTGDNLRCRSYHMENAVIDVASHQTHCPHTGLVSATCFNTASDGGTDSGTPDSGTPDSAGD